MIGFNAILREFGATPERTWLSRHQDARLNPGWTTYKLWRNRPEEFLDYQATQQPNRFNTADHLAAFIVDPAGECIFVGLFEIGQEQPFRRSTEWLAIPMDDLQSNVVRYDLRHNPAMLDLEGRLVIDWGKGARAWAQRAGNGDKPVIEIKRHVVETEWPGFEQVEVFDYEINSLSANWITRLSSVKGIYLLLCSQSGQQYIGTAFGSDGFYGRWLAYTNGGHGGNAELIARSKQTNAPMKLSILEVLGSSATMDDALQAESLWKRKLGSRVFGLNAN